MKTAELIIRKTATLMNSVSCAALAVLMLLVTVNVVLRAVFKSPILGTYDLSGFLTVLVIGFGLAFCSLENGHIEIGFFVDKMAVRPRFWITTLGKSLSGIVLAAYTYALFALADRLMRANELSVTTRTPLFIIVYLLAFCFAVFSLTVLSSVVLDCRKEARS